MKLLSKKDINTAQATTQKQTYDEGMKLARRVDSLREVAAAEESALEKFRRETIAKIHEETTEARTERERLLAEVRKLQKDREEALKPLDEEHQRNTEEAEALETKRTALADLDSRCGQRMESLDGRERSIRDEELRIAEQKRIHTDLLSSAHNDRAGAKTALEDAQRTLVNNRLEETRLAQEAEKLALQTKSAQERQAKRDKEQDVREKELNARETRLADRERLLERNLKRHG